ncbi:hypothetical protein ACJDT4_11890 [Clostridium neuense]|uniref:Pyruvate carboxyltransferase domain-containing protein n=1 Tax=Clostridium neuense TaxID=1728934 RepID=A0ABW8TFB3_9CLOT
MKVNIIDTTLNYSNEEFMNLDSYKRIEAVKFISGMGVSQLEIKFNLNDKDLRKEIIQITNLDLKSKISVYSRLDIENVRRSIDIGTDVIHISVPLYKNEDDKNRIKENIKRCINCCIEESECEVTVGIEDASRADINFIIELSKIVLYEGARRIRYCDGVGILYPKRILHQIKTIKEAVDMPIEISAKDEYGMGIVNSIGAIKAGAEYMVSSMFGKGRKIDNCNYFKFIKSVYESTENIIFTNKFKNMHELDECEIALKKVIGEAV